MTEMIELPDLKTTIIKNASTSMKILRKRKNRVPTMK
jgi:hypothetical protein